MTCKGKLKMNAISKSCLSLILLTISATVLCSCGEEIRKEYYENGNIKAETTYKENILHGKAIYYFKNGDIKETGYYKNGKKHGEWLEFCHNGQKKEETHYVDGKEDGVRKRWEKDCSILSSETHYSKGKKHGPSKMWKNGKPMDEILYSEGEVVGVKVWNDDGSINCELTTDQELCPNK